MALALRRLALLAGTALSASSPSVLPAAAARASGNAATMRRPALFPALLMPVRHASSNFIPKRVKHRKHFKGRVRGYASNGYTVVYGTYGIQVLEPVRLKSRQLEAARRAISRKIKRLGRLWARVFPDIPVTKKPTEVRMGKGKGAVDHYIARVKAHKVIFELDGVPKELAQDAFRLAAFKLPVRTRFLDKNSPTYPKMVAEMERAFVMTHRTPNNKILARQRAIRAAEAIEAAAKKTAKDAPNPAAAPTVAA